jgi:hypothetical protein
LCSSGEAAAFWCRQFLAQSCAGYSIVMFPARDLGLGLTEGSPELWRRIANRVDELGWAPDFYVVVGEGYEHEAVRRAKKFMCDAASVAFFSRTRPTRKCSGTASSA